MPRTPHPAQRTITFAAGLVSLVVLATPSLAVADADRGVHHETRNRSVVVPETDNNEPPSDPQRRLPGHFDPPPITGSGRDTKSSTWLTDPRLRYPPDSPHLDYSPWVARAQPLEQSSSTTEDGSLAYAQIALGGLTGVAVMAAAAGTLAGRRRRQQPLEAALASGDPDELPRAAGLLGDHLVQQNRAGAAEHAYRAAIDVGDEYWSPIAQVALADLLSNRGERAEAQALLEAAVASGHTRAVAVAQANLRELLTGTGHKGDAGPTLAYETLGDAAPARREPVGSRRPPIT